MINLENLSDEEKEKLRVNHYTLHLPASLTKEQLVFIQKMAKSVINNEPFLVIKETYLQFLLRMGMEYRNALIEFDESRRWSEDNEINMNILLTEFKPMADWIIEQYKIKRLELE